MVFVLIALLFFLWWLDHEFMECEHFITIFFRFVLLLLFYIISSSKNMFDVVSYTRMKWRIENINDAVEQYGDFIKQMLYVTDWNEFVGRLNGQTKTEYNTSRARAISIEICFMLCHFIIVPWWITCWVQVRNFSILGHSYDIVLYAFWSWIVQFFFSPLFILCLFGLFLFSFF